MTENNETLFLDMGSGIANFDLYQNIIANNDEVNIVLSHYHFDHIIGFIYLLNICRDKVINIWGPGMSFYGKTCHDILSNIISQPYFGRDIDDFSKRVTINDYELGKNRLTNNFIIEIIEQVHSSPSFGIFVNNTLYYATDTNVNDQTFKAAAHSKLLLHECWDIQKNGNVKHSSLVDIISYIETYNIRNTGLIHLNPNWDDDTYQIAKQMLKNKNVFFVNDGDIYEL